MSDFFILNVFNEQIQEYNKKIKKYDVFLSHKQAESQDRAKVYKCYLENKGFNVFLDRDSNIKDADWTPQKIMELVGSSASLIFLLTPTIFDASWCQWELYIALKCNIPIKILLVDPWPGQNINIKKLNIPSFFKNLFIKSNILIDDRYKTNECIEKLILILKKNNIKISKKKIKKI